MSSPIKPKFGWLDLGIFPGHILVAVGKSYEETINHLNKEKYPSWVKGIEGQKHFFEDEDCAGFAHKSIVENDKTGEKVTCLYIVLNDGFRLNDSGYVTIAHEILHIIQFYLTKFLDRGIEHEAEAYLHSYLMKGVLKIIRSNKESK